VSARSPGMAESWHRGDNSRWTGCNDAAGSGVTMMAAPTTRWQRLRRRLRGDGNPLRRREDLIEGWLPPIAITVFLVLCPFVILGIGGWIHGDNAAAQRAEQASRPATAVLLAAAPGPLEADHGANAWMEWTPARWTADGNRLTGQVPAPSGSPKGSHVTIHLNQAGQVLAAPMTGVQVGDRIIDAATLALSTLAIVLAILTALVKRGLDRHRLAGWETEWLVVGERWSHLS